MVKRMQERGVFQKDIKNAILTGEIIEQYVDDKPFPSCLILGQSTNNVPLHVVCGCSGDNAYIITAYLPSNDKFEADNKTRKG